MKLIDTDELAFKLAEQIAKYGVTPDAIDVQPQGHAARVTVWLRGKSMTLVTTRQMAGAR